MDIANIIKTAVEEHDNIADSQNVEEQLIAQVEAKLKDLESVS
jgi:hypothetical protein